MTIQLSPEDEQLVQARLRSGVFRSAEEVIHDALAAQDAETAWLVDRKNEIQDKIARGIAQLDRGQGLTEQAAGAQLQELKYAWIHDRRK